MPTHPGSSSRMFYSLHEPDQSDRGSITLLHGLGSCGDDWLLQVPPLVGHYRILAPDLPGHGNSSLERRLPLISHYADDVASLIAAQELYPTHVVGLSLGGLVAQQLALDYPELVRSLTLVNTFPQLKTALGRRKLRSMGRLSFLLRGNMEGVGQWVAEGLFPGPDQAFMRQAAAERIGSNPRRAYLQAMWAAFRFNSRRRLPEINTPTLVVAGDADTTVSMDANMELVRCIPGAQLAVIPNSGHATPIDAADEFNQTLLDFLCQLDVGS